MKENYQIALCYNQTRRHFRNRINPTLTGLVLFQYFIIKIQKINRKDYQKNGKKNEQD